MKKIVEREFAPFNYVVEGDNTEAVEQAAEELKKLFDFKNSAVPHTEFVDTAERITEISEKYGVKIKSDL